ncbi:uncharacterized protein (DUF427 family) [Actinoplanes campanulatus]|uniref:Uncharacterized protein (DUF427 family) n=1 Tax=Actinoplanes campanulatus TaxID=113559 RepID=A0A7W5AI19_9ACTN|nr:DUF427 domain-containing protein [Actinoplanes campanulatus]MBB3096673.1 uncharacterized protein (DUF427 family) [Actinoplanes campanulatus]GGN30592.1 hypothetical protein GCM10010109_50310 [Actinoplanes campanulatus]GID37216.1 hypothetical protein Aca09nite_37220 [Actinoplanes campanulatus]
MAKLRLEPGPDHPITVSPAGEKVVVTAGGRVIAETGNALLLQEAHYPPVRYVPLADVDPAVLERSTTTSYCPYKGDATYYSLPGAPDAVWEYQDPYDAVAAIKGHVAFYPDKVEFSA